MSNPAVEFMDMDLLARLPSLELRARFIVEGFLTGLHRSPLRGSSVEFMEYRDYQQGDDARSIDWKNYARTDRLHVRLREDETNMRAYLLLDRSASMNYRSRNELLTKWDYARSLAAALLLFLHRQRDAVSLGMVGDGLEEFLSGEGAGSVRFHAMTAALHCEAEADRSRLADALDELALKARRRSIVMVISDFYEDLEQLKRSLDRFSHEKCEILLFQTLDPAELDLSLSPAGIFIEQETGMEMAVTPDVVREKYRRAIDSHRERLQTVARLRSGDCLVLPTDTPPLKALGLYLSKRRGY